MALRDSYPNLNEVAVRAFKKCSEVFVRGDVSIVRDNDKANGRRMTAVEVACAFGHDAVRQIEDDGSFIIQKMSNCSSEFIKQRLKDVNLTEFDLADRMALKPRYLGKLLSGKHYFPMRQLERACYFLGLDDGRISAEPVPPPLNNIAFTCTRDARDAFSVDDAVVVLEKLWKLNKLGYANDLIALSTKGQKAERSAFGQVYKDVLPRGILQLYIVSDWNGDIVIVQDINCTETIQWSGSGIARPAAEASIVFNRCDYDSVGRVGPVGILSKDLENLASLSVSFVKSSLSSAMNLCSPWAGFAPTLERHSAHLAENPGSDSLIGLDEALKSAVRDAHDLGLVHQDFIGGGHRYVTAIPYEGHAMCPNCPRRGRRLARMSDDAATKCTGYDECANSVRTPRKTSESIRTPTSARTAERVTLG